MTVVINAALGQPKRCKCNNRAKWTHLHQKSRFSSQSFDTRSGLTSCIDFSIRTGRMIVCDGIRKILTILRTLSSNPAGSGSRNWLS